MTQQETRNAPRESPIWTCYEGHYFISSCTVSEFSAEFLTCKFPIPLSHAWLFGRLIRNLNTEGNKNNSIRRWITSSFYLTTRERAVADVTQRLHQCCFTQKAELAGFQTPWPEDIYVTLRRGCLLLVGRGFQVLFTQTLLKKNKKTKKQPTSFKSENFPKDDSALP